MLTSLKMIPNQVKEAVGILKEGGFQAFLVGGCVRDLLRNIEPEDWDIATNAKPQDIQKLFEKKGFKAFYENRFGTVTVQFPNFKTKIQNKLLPKDIKVSIQNFKFEIEITPFRKESKYTDKRHPDKIEWARTIQEDLARRDFTVNAMALNLETYQVIDLFNGQKDLKEKIIRAVGEPAERFEEDALRLMRAIRFSVQLGPGWSIEQKTFEAIKEKANLIQYISKERIRDELIKIIMTDRAREGIDLLKDTGLLKYVLPELQENINVSQNKHHIYDCYEHAVRSLDYAAKKNFSLYVRLAALFHDIGKPRTKRGEGPDATFYNHEVVGAQMTKAILQRLCFPAKDIEKITKLVRYHLFYYNVGEVKESAVRRLVRKVGFENMEELLQLRQADRIGSGVPKAEPYKLRHLRYMIEKVSRDPLSPKMLKINGTDIMELLGIKPGPKIGQILNILMSYVLEDPTKNNPEFLKEKTKELGQLSDAQLKEMAQKAIKEIESIEQKQDQMTKKKYWVS